MRGDIQLALGFVRERRFNDLVQFSLQCTGFCLRSHQVRGSYDVPIMALQEQAIFLSVACSSSYCNCLELSRREYPNVVQCTKRDILRCRPKLLPIRYVRLAGLLLPHH